MAPSSLRFPVQLALFTLLVVFTATPNPRPVLAQIDPTSLQLTLEWPSTMSVEHGEYVISDEDEDLDGEGGATGGIERRSLYWRSTGTRPYYISYGALSANRIPCPARSGRSYYTHNCFGASGPVHPYTRGCSTITRCRR